MDADIIVIGSGFGGSVCALRAAEAGMRVIVLERGGRMTPAAFDDLAAGHTGFIRRIDAPGIFDLHIGPGLASLTGSAVGGGSHVYTAVTLPAPPEVFRDHWPAGVNAESLRPFYERVDKVIAPSPIPRPIERVRALQILAARLGAPATVLPVAIDWPKDSESMEAIAPPEGARPTLTAWLQGGRACRKRTLDRTYLGRAERAGCVIRAFHEAHNIIPAADGYRICCRRFGGGYINEVSFSAARVVLAAGTINTLRLLISCRDRLLSLPELSPSLGKRFFTNSDFGALLINPRVDLPPDAGPPVTSWIDFWKDSRLFLMETGAFIPMGNPKRKRVWSFGMMGFGESPSQIVMDRDGRLGRIAGYDPIEKVARRRFRELAEAAEATLLMAPRWLLGGRSATVHPLGGAAMAETCDRGVVNPFGEVFGYPGLYVADGAILPTPTGGPPSMTIAALAERIADAIVKR